MKKKVKAALSASYEKLHTAYSVHYNRSLETKDPWSLWVTPTGSTWDIISYEIAYRLNKRFPLCGIDKSTITKFFESKDPWFYETMNRFIGVSDPDDSNITARDLAVWLLATKATKINKYH